jgi:hypothetical protein
VSAELVLSEQVRASVARVAPHAPRLIDALVERALTTYAAGASVSEACEEARRLVGCWTRHPASRRREYEDGLPGAP